MTKKEGETNGGQGTGHVERARIKYGHPREQKNNSTQMVTYYIATCLKAKQTSIFFVWFAQRH